MTSCVEAQEQMDTFEAEVSALSHDGRGIARVSGKAVFVAGVLPGERARLRTMRRHRQYDEAALVELLDRAPDRVEPRCPHFGTCGGCTLQHLAPSAQLAAKQRVLADNFERIGNLKPRRWLEPVTGSEWGYRRKGRLSVKWVEKKSRVLVGFRERDPRYVADLSVCHTLVPEVGNRIRDLAALLGSLEARASIPQIEIAAGDDVIALTFRHLQPLGESDRAALLEFGRRRNLAILLQPGGADSVVPLWPESLRLAYTIAGQGVELEFEPLDFVQVNGGVNAKMVALAIELLAVDPGDRVLDLFCGIGNFTLPLARLAADVTGVEGEAALVARARANAARNGIDNARFHAADLATDQRASSWAQQPYDRILLDPPRSGAAAVLDGVAADAVKRIVYVSCHPAALARDAGELVARHGFVLDAAGVLDMFPHTAHVESIASFIRAGNG